MYGPDLMINESLGHPAQPLQLVVFLSLGTLCHPSLPIAPLAEELFQLEKETEFAKGTNRMKLGAGRQLCSLTPCWGGSDLGCSFADSAPGAPGVRSCLIQSPARSRLTPREHSPLQCRFCPVDTPRKGLPGRPRHKYTTLLPSCPCHSFAHRSSPPAFQSGG